MDECAIPVLHSEQEIAERVEELAEEIAAQIQGDVLIVSLLRGSFMFTADLVRALYRVGVQPQIDFMTLSSYEGTSSTGEVIINRDITDDVADKTVLIVDDILETGRTLQFAIQTIKARNPKAIKTCMLLEKPGKLDTPMAADFVGFRIPDKFVIGYGLDFDSHYRELPYIGYLEIH
ncbi:MAG: hypoxanthine phosphoribosyltransferase [Rickettsiales bacterium]|nr:hypoxanthine phosphoribosyltransferase [Rickettsiales bacterium]|tara:strand:- start:451 stop:981 length:531 start_codon:yes stop_codon:yes gene_type:complete